MWYKYIIFKCEFPSVSSIKWFLKCIIKFTLKMYSFIWIFTVLPNLIDVIVPKMNKKKIPYTRPPITKYNHTTYETTTSLQYTLLIHIWIHYYTNLHYRVECSMLINYIIILNNTFWYIFIVVLIFVRNFLNISFIYI